MWKPGEASKLTKRKKTICSTDNVAHLVIVTKSYSMKERRMQKKILGMPEDTPCLEPGWRKNVRLAEIVSGMVHDIPRLKPLRDETPKPWKRKFSLGKREPTLPNQTEITMCSHISQRIRHVNTQDDEYLACQMQEQIFETLALVPK